MHMTEEELSKIVESKLEGRLAARLAADRARVREEVVAELRREAAAKEYDRINARHPIQGPGDPKVEAERRRLMDERARADAAFMDRANARPVDGDLRAQRAAHKGGRSGFTIK
jgi:hypothetical protein